MAVTDGGARADGGVTKPFTDAIAEAEALVASAEFAETDADRAEGLDYLAGGISSILHLAGTYSKTHPTFVTSTGPYSKMGLDNPDTIYYHANVVPDATYVVRGVRGSTTDLSFQVLRGDYTPTDVPGGDDAFDDRRITVAADGSFEITFGPDQTGAGSGVSGPNQTGAGSGVSGPNQPGAGSDCFALGEGASMLAVREVYSDWDTERRGSVTIERVDSVGTAPPEPTEANLARRYRIAASMLKTRVNTWFNFPKWFYLDEPVNTFTAPRTTPGGLSTQYSSVGHFDLPAGKSMVVTVPCSNAPYQGFQLGSLWYISLDYVNHQTSLNSAQAQTDPDGMIRMVISANDPGVANWVETTGRRRGILQFRWQRVDDPIGPESGPTCVVVDDADVPAHLPFFDDNRIDAAGWSARIAARQRAFANRMLG
ncbi:hypothetical protein L5G28_05545 [Gordonia sp. HY285]|uniref:hypothetical protein n=1 Tax=Gordonia liuliyuniae TaxID=2911517 RepID=UPI001F2EB801|nr:hypothetical protein [Gordonia liuliyuniae]MCF8609627.1 hypothetical protein [Gordonia liuliyuniae]